MVDGNSRRGFIGLFAVAAGAAAASLLTGCAQDQEEAPSGPVVVPLRAGMHHFNTVPRLASVRLIDAPYISEEVLTSKGDSPIG